jgi:peroxiredoxin
LRGFEKHLQEFRERGIAIAAISTDSPAESRKLSDNEGYTYPFLSDPHAEVIRRYGVIHARAGENNRDIARPAEFLVDATGAIRWVKLTDDVRVRARPEEVIQVADRLIPVAGSGRAM